MTSFQRYWYGNLILKRRLKVLKIATFVIVLFMKEIRVFLKCPAKLARTSSMLLASENGSDSLIRATAQFVKITSSDEN